MTVQPPKTAYQPPTVGEPVPQIGTAGEPVRQSNLWRDAWHRYVRNRGAFLAGLIFLLLVLDRRFRRPGAHSCHFSWAAS